MSTFFYNAGRKAGHAFWKGRWWYKSLFGSEEEAIRAENMVGRQIAHEIGQQFTRNCDAKLQDSVEEIGQKLVSRLKNKKRKFRFTVLADTRINAFALPGGFIYSTDGLLQFCQLNENDIAFVLAHEIAHVVKRHPFKRVLAGSSLKILSNMSKASGVLGSITKQTVRNLLENGYSQDQEAEADRFAVKMMEYTEFDLAGSIRFLKRLKERAANEETGLGYFSSHPKIDERISRIRGMIKTKNIQTTSRV